MNLYKNYDRKVLLDLEKLNLAFDLQKTNSTTLKDSFINLFKSPLSNFFSRNDMFHCLKNINLQVYEGDRIGLVGKNGAGKTSLCHIFAGNFMPTSGKISRYCQIRSVFSANSQLFPELTGGENAFIVARLLYPFLSDIEIKEITLESIVFSELEEFQDVAIKNYSKGMAARLFLSLITARATELLILDEVFDGSDLFFKQKFAPRLENILEKSKAAIFINHDTKMLKAHVNRVIVLNKGEITFDGNPTKGFFLYENI
jgi:ABC-type polysaccharide/polyol phosphate transport system ATPase subunit